ncbi:sensor histidine kinase [Streptosporangium sp. NBC_01755]|uniref:sensor histidine kinase n=1 Tax=unclassified Streptosporangium TaxID=2632669 RepID=UPI002DDC49EA|nr:MULTISPECIES: sensor histidine kinase [unclassified Streptosporangium]WSA28657.1 sensor histidine kinase [Streptosporangium sp. NBC_01810]WSC99891.1 sensor histidine kinase [Streptosporangium sp. NBC_01755]WSD03184.1 sensor histidine kinase [Streptosporangium sp. NBC_01755]
MMDFPFPPTLKLLRWAIHGTFAVLLAIAVAGAAHEGHAAVATCGVLLGVLYAAGIVIEGRLPRFGGPAHLLLGRIWLLIVTLGWAALALNSPLFVWLAFPLFFAYLHVLPLMVALPGVAALSVAAIATAGRHTGGVSAPQVIGPSIGAAVATLMGLVYKALYSESEQRRLLIDDLVRTRGMLMQAEADTARLAERERLAREIHDTLAQGMSSIILLLRAARRDLATRPGDAEQRIAEAEHAAQDNLEEARNFVRALAPPALQHSSLTAALRRISASAAAGTPTRVGFEMSGTPVPLSADYDLALLRIAQGALGNVSRHAQAAHATVTLTYLDDMIVLDIVDDGCGFVPAQAPAETASTGYGLRTMHDRARALGGSLTIESAPGEGTAVAATLPLPEGAAR